MCFVEEKVEEKETRPFILRKSILEWKEKNEARRKGKSLQFPYDATTLRNKKSIVEKTIMNYLLSRVSRSFNLVQRINQFLIIPFIICARYSVVFILTKYEIRDVK